MTSMTCDDVRDLAPAFVLGALAPHEEQAVAEHLRTCPEPHAEFEELGSVVPYLDDAVTLVEPPPALRARIMAAAADELASRRTPTAVIDMPILPARPTAVPPATADSTGPTAVVESTARLPAPTTPTTPTTITLPTGEQRTSRIVSLDQARTRSRDLRTWALGIAAVLAIVVLGSINLATQQQLATARSYQERLSAALVQAGQPGSQVAVLASTGGPGAGPGGIAVMPAHGSGLLVVSGLAPTSGSQVYQAWAIVDAQPPVPIAGFTVGSDGIGYFDKMPSATGQPVTVAITLEPAPNPTVPSSQPVAAGVAAQRGVSG